MRRVTASLLASLVCVGPALAEPPARPKYNPNQPHLEDWSALRAGEPQPSDFFDPIKFIPLDDNGDIWLSIGGQARARFEAWNNYLFNPDNDDTFGLMRLRVHGDLHVGEYVRFFVEGRSSTLLGDRDLPGGRRSADIDTLDLQQGFAEFTLPILDDDSLSLRVGRQEFFFGKQRLVSPSDWGNTRRSWDGARVDAAINDANVSAFYTRFAPVKKYDFNDGDPNDEFYGIYATSKLPIESLSVDGYVLGRSREDIDEDRYTLGGRLFGKPGDGPFDFDVEAGYQFGEVGNDDIAAWFFASEIGYAFADAAMKPRVYAGFDYASGDDDAADDDRETFIPPFPLGHSYLGYIDVVGRQNVIATNLGVSIQPTNKLQIDLTGHGFWRAETEDALYDSGGSAIRNGSDERFVGAEIDLLARYTLDAHTVLLAGYSHFFPGDFIDATGEDEQIDFAYAQIEFNF